jgi:DNA modification methylase
VVLDPFGGSGTTSKVALELGRKPVHIDLTYHELARKRMTTTPAMAGLMTVGR